MVRRFRILETNAFFHHGNILNLQCEGDIENSFFVSNYINYIRPNGWLTEENTFRFQPVAVKPLKPDIRPALNWKSNSEPGTWHLQLWFSVHPVYILHVRAVGLYDSIESHSWKNRLGHTHLCNSRVYTVFILRFSKAIILSLFTYGQYESKWSLKISVNQITVN